MRCTCGTTNGTNSAEVNTYLLYLAMLAKFLWLAPGQSRWKDFKTCPNFRNLKMWKMYILP